MIKIGDKIPAFTFQQHVGGKTQDISTTDVFTGKKVVLFAVPGAFTPTCSEQHLPGFVALVEEMRAKGIDAIACTAVNDSFVLSSWQQSHNADSILMLADGNGEFAKLLGVEMDTGNFGGVRSQRYAMVVDNGEVKQFFLEKPKEFEVSRAKSVLDNL